MSSSPEPSTERPFESVAVLGLGAMGGSIVRALSALDPAPVVVGWSPLEGERVAALNAGVVARAPSAWQDAVAGADLVVLAAPLKASCGLVAGVVAAMSSETTLSDVASLKVPVARAVADVGAEARWVGSHPMTGTEASGFAASRTDLYAGSRVWTVAHPTAAPRVARVHSFWESLGARPAAIEAAEHDQLMALASHLPQLVANALASVLAEAGVAPDSLGPGGTDMTRLAVSNSALWRDIIEHASPELVGGLRSLADASGRIADLLEAGHLDGIERLMKSTRAWSLGT